jgi:protein-glutamine gamma-glutamyltransferase
VLRTAIAYSLPALVIGVSWGRLESSGSPVFALVLLALAPALLPRLAWRLLAVLPALVAAVWVAFDVSPLEARPRDGTHDYFGPLWSAVMEGLRAFYDVRVPFSGTEEPEMQGLVLLAVFGFCIVLGLAIASRRPLLALLALLAGAGWPMTLYPPAGVLFGAIVLTGALWLLAALRVDRPTPAVATGALVVAAAAAISTSAAFAKGGVLDWTGWEPYGLSNRPVSVDFVWDANYGGIEFPSRETTVLRIRGPERSHYWRSTTLDLFTEDRWIENLSLVTSPVEPGRLVRDPRLPARARNRLYHDPLLPARAADEENWTRQEVEIVALSDEHLAAASTPVLLDATDLGRIDLLTGEVLRHRGPLRRGQRYIVESHAPRPETAQLAAFRAEYPSEATDYLQIGRTTVPTFGTVGRRGTVESLFTDERYLPLWPYEGLYRQAERLATGARGPYGAVVAIETWLRETGGFSYDEQPPSSSGVPPLAYFVGEGRRGYCQHFAGSMALMLRFLGIPTRIAAGFTSGRYRNGIWTVTDRNAHTWVEVWFPRYGWLPFDPTPGRGAIGADYSVSSDAFNPGDAADRAFGSVRGGFDPGGAGELSRLTLLKEQREANRGITVGDEGVSTLWILLVLLAGAALAVGLLKLLRRRARYLTRDPRRLAGAARSELAGFLLDQGMAVRASATPEELHLLVRERLGIDARPFAAAVEQARYGPPGPSQTAAAAARRELRALLRLIRRSLSRAQRVRGYLTLRSLRA